MHHHNTRQRHRFIHFYFESKAVFLRPKIPSKKACACRSQKPAAGYGLAGSDAQADVSQRGGAERAHDDHVPQPELRALPQLAAEVRGGGQEGAAAPCAILYPRELPAVWAPFARGTSIVSYNCLLQCPYTCGAVAFCCRITFFVKITHFQISMIHLAMSVPYPNSHSFHAERHAPTSQLIASQPVLSGVSEEEKA